MAKAPATEVRVGERTVRISNPDRVYFPATGATKLDLVDYYLAVGPGIVNALRERPCMLHRFPTGRRAARRSTRSGCRPARRRGSRRCGVHFPRYGLHADELCVTELADVIWAVQMSTVEFHPWNSRRADVEKPDEWRIDLDPMPRLPARPRCGGSPTSRTRCSTSSARSAGRRRPAASGLHVYVRIEPSHGFTDVRRAALAFAREVERRAPDWSTTTWWRKDRDPAALFVDYNQNARDHTMAAAYSVRGVPDATVSTPITLGRGRRRRARRLHDGHRAARASPSSATSTPASTSAVFAIDELLEWAARDERAGASTRRTARGGPSARPGRADSRPARGLALLGSGRRHRR